MAGNGSPAPVFETDEERIAYVVRLPVHPLTRAAEATDQVATDVTTDVATDVSAEVAALLAVVQGEMARPQLQVAMGLRNDEHFRKAYLVPAIAGGLLEMTLPGKPRSPRQRYRLTAKGRQWLGAQTGSDRS